MENRWSVSLLKALFIANVFLVTSLNVGSATRNMDDVLPPEKRVCGVPTLHMNLSSGGYDLFLETENSFIPVFGTEKIERVFKGLATRNPVVGVCLPSSDFATGEPPYRMTMLAWIDPGHSGVSVTNQ